MNAGKLESMVQGQGSWHDQSARWAALSRYAAMVGIELPNWSGYTEQMEQARAMEIPIEAAQKILALDFSARSTRDLREMGEGVSKVNIAIPSNINVWQHIKGEARLANAAQALTDAVEKIAKE